MDQSPAGPNGYLYRLGLNDGDVIVDRVHKQVLIVKNNDAEKLADFAETPASSSHRKRPGPQAKD